MTQITLNAGTMHFRSGGVDPGRAISVEGVAREEHGRVTMLNPTYTLLTTSP